MQYNVLRSPKCTLLLIATSNGIVYARSVTLRHQDRDLCRKFCQLKGTCGLIRIGTSGFEAWHLTCNHRDDCSRGTPSCSKASHSSQGGNTSWSVDNHKWFIPSSRFPNCAREFILGLLVNRERDGAYKCYAG